MSGLQIIAKYLAECHQKYACTHQEDAARHSSILIAGLNGPQGVGKSTLCSKLPQLLLDKYNLRLAILSLDDFYLPHSKQLELQTCMHPQNKLLQGRGLPGTHDMTLARQCLNELMRSSGTVRVPVYDKSAYGGQGDRVKDINRWHCINLPVDLVLIEGWMVGFRPVSVDSILSPDMRIVNEYLSNQYQQGWHWEINVLICLRPQLSASSMRDHVYRWREEQEDSLRRRLNDPTAGLSADQLTEFIDRFIPCYTAYLDELYSGCSSSTVDKSIGGWWPALRSKLIIKVDGNRMPTDVDEWHSEGN